jgi:hypothetical protein
MNAARVSPLTLALVFLLAFVAGASAAAAAADNDAWLMMVATRNTDPAREAQFNAWYDDIDIPDVLEVPGYMRARRGLRLGTPENPVSALPDDEGRYVALYDITSNAIDKTIIEMLMATRKMEARGRTTDLLKVTERVYYHRYAQPVDARNVASSDKRDFIYVERIDCCSDAATERRFNAWYDDSYLTETLQTAGILRATRYELYRVLMIEPKQATRYLTVYELQAESTAAAVTMMSDLRQRLRSKATQTGLFGEHGSLMYSQIRDVKRSR